MQLQACRSVDKMCKSQVPGFWDLWVFPPIVSMKADAKYFLLITGALQFYFFVVELRPQCLTC